MSLWWLWIQRWRREDEELVVIMDAVMVDAMVVDMDTMVEDVRRRKWWFSFV